jgi:hypothetical protein
MHSFVRGHWSIRMIRKQPRASQKWSISNNVSNRAAWICFLLLRLRIVKAKEMLIYFSRYVKKSLLKLGPRYKKLSPNTSWPTACRTCTSKNSRYYNHTRLGTDPEICSGTMFQSSAAVPQDGLHASAERIRHDVPRRIAAVRSRRRAALPID